MQSATLRPSSLDLGATAPEMSTLQQSRASDLSPTSSPPLRHAPLRRDGEEFEQRLVNELAAHSDTTMEPTKTPAERARELTILKDPLANLLSPYHVECKQCKKKIKLSSKSAYDTFHWRNHRTRCLRTFKKRGKKPKARDASTPPPSKQSPPSPLSKVSPSKALVAPSSPLCASIVDRKSSMTPPLISDDEEDQDRRSERSSEVQSPTIPCHTIPSVQSPPSIPSHDHNVQDYMARSHPGYIPRHSAGAADNSNWRTWTWAQLKAPQFLTGAAVGTYSDDEDEDMDESEDEDDSSQELSPPLMDERIQEAARTLSMLSRSRAR